MNAEYILWVTSSRRNKSKSKEANGDTSSSGCLVSELDWPRSDPSFQVRRQSPVIVHSAAHMGWAIIRVRFDLGTHLMNTIRLARAPTEVASCLNQSMKPTAPFRNESSVFATTPCRGLSLS